MSARLHKLSNRHFWRLPGTSYWPCEARAPHATLQLQAATRWHALELEQWAHSVKQGQAH